MGCEKYIMYALIGPQDMCFLAPESQKFGMPKESKVLLLKESDKCFEIMSRHLCTSI